ncbi:MAG: GEVED domain-containing protein [Flavobacteriales bacterium]
MQIQYFGMLLVTGLMVGASAQAQRTDAADLSIPAQVRTAIAHPNMPVERGGGAPANDLCSTVVPEALAPGSPLTFTGTTVGATGSADYAVGSPLAASLPAVWHAFTTTVCGAVTVSYCGTDPVFTNAAGFLSADCPIGNNYLAGVAYACDDGNFTIIYGNVAPGTYYVPVWSAPGFAFGPYTIGVSMEPCPPGYCIPDPFVGSFAGDSIARVQLGAIDYVSPGVSDYSDNTDQITDLVVGVEYTLSITGGEYAPDAYAAWIDYDNDENFSPDEKLGQVFSVSQPGELVTITFTVPLDAPQTTDRLRVRCVSSPAPVDACTNFVYGETEDYSVHIVQATAVADQQAVVFAVLPNPSSGDLWIAPATYGPATLQLVDLSGRLIHTEQVLLVPGTLHALSLAGQLAAGSYVLRISTAAGSSSRSVVVQ